ncbi:hypothetical protein D3C87_2148170 [compost metagenome]
MKGSSRGATGSARSGMPGSWRLTRSRICSTEPIFIEIGNWLRSVSVGMLASAISTKRASWNRVRSLIVESRMP